MKFARLSMAPSFSAALGLSMRSALGEVLSVSTFVPSSTTQTPLCSKGSAKRSTVDWRRNRVGPGQLG